MDRDSYQCNLRHLRAMVATRRLGSISAAAKAVNLSQPAVTQGIAKLEAIAGSTLFDRHPSGMTATVNGALLAERTDAALASLREGFEAVKRAGGAARGEQSVTMAQIRALLALATAGSFATGAAQTGLSQPSLHRAVRDLETQCRVPLVERRGRGVALTSVGRRLARAFSLAVSEIRAGLDEITLAKGERTGLIRVGAMPLARARLLPLALADFHRDMPAMTVEVVEGPYGELIERLRDGALDFLIGALRSPEPGPDVEQTALFEDQLVIVGRGSHPLVGTFPSLESLAAFPWAIGREGTPLRAQWEALFTVAGLKPPHAPVVCGSVMTIRTLLFETDFLTLLSPHQVQHEIASGTLAAIGQPIAATRRPIGLTMRSNWRPGSAHALLIGAIRRSISKAALQEIE